MPSNRSALLAPAILLALTAVLPIEAHGQERPWLAKAYWSHSFAAAIENAVALDIDGDGWSEMSVITADGRLSVLDLAGRVRWSRAVPSAQAVQQPVDLDGDGRSGLLAAVRDVSNTLILLDDTGEELWQRSFESRISSFARVPLEDGAGSGILVGLSSGLVLLLDAEGRTLWSHPVRGGVATVAAGELKQGERTTFLIGTTVFGPAGGEMGVHALTATGEALWVSDPLRTGFRGAVESVDLMDPGGDGSRGLLLLTSSDDRQQVCRFSATGKRQWCRPIEGQASAGKSLRTFSMAGRDWVVAAGSGLQTFDAGGRLLWSYREGSPHFVGRELMDTDGDGKGEIIAIFQQWRPEPVTHVVAFAFDGRIARRWRYPGFVHWTHELRLPSGPEVVTGAGRLCLVLNRKGIRAFPSTSRKGLILAGDFNHDGAAEGLLADGPVLSLFGLPRDSEPAVPHRIWREKVDARSFPAVAAVDPTGWIAAAGGLEAWFQEELTRVTDFRLASPWGEVLWSRREKGQVNGLWLGPASPEKSPALYAAVSTSGVLHSSDFNRFYDNTPGELLALDGQGAPLWRARLPGPPAALTGHTDSDGRLRLLAVGLAGDPNRGFPGVAAFDATGHLLWKVAAPGPVLQIQASGRGVVAAGLVRDRGGFLLGIHSGGGIGWERELAGEPAALLVSDLTGDGQPELLVGLRRNPQGFPLLCFSLDGKKLWELRIAGQAAAVASGDLDGDGRAEAVIVSRGTSSQIHVLDGNGRLVLAAGLPGVPAAVAVAPALRGRPARILAALQPGAGTARGLVLDSRGRIQWSHELEGPAVALSSWHQDPGANGLLYATAEGWLGLIGPAFRPPPLIAAPEVGLDAGELAAFVVPTGREARATLQVWRDWRGDWESLGSRQTAAETPVRLSWPIQPFGLRDLGRPARFRFQLTDPGYSGRTEPIVAAARLPWRWRYLQRAGMVALGFLVPLAVPAGAFLYRQSRRRGPRSRDVLLCATAAPDAAEAEVRLTSGARSLSYRRSLADEPTAQVAAAVLAQGAIQEDRVRDCRDLLQHLLFNAAAREWVFGSRRSTRLRLDFARAPRLASLPWELLQLRERASGRGFQEKLTVLRYVPPGGENPVLPVVRKPLRILFVSPSHDVDSAAEVQSIASALEEPHRRGQVEWRFLSGAEARFDNLGPEMAQGCDVLHFMGHGARRNGTVYLEFLDEFNDPDPIEMGQLRELFLRADRSLQVPWLVFLSYCHSAASDLVLPDPALGLLGPSRVLALVAMQQEIRGDAARAFAASFYRSLLASCRIDHAAACGRSSIFGVLEGERDLRSLDWMRPAVYTCVKDGRVFEWE